jgi:hypothetical protein
MFLPGADRKTPLLSLPQSISRVAIRNALICLLGLTALRVIAQTAQTDDQPKKITGTVINSATKAPITRALVYSSDNRVATLTDSEGHFEFTVPKQMAGSSGRSVFFSGGHEYQGCSSWIQARKPGFLDCIDSQAGLSDTDLTIALVPEAIIRGRVSVGNSEPLSGTGVQLFCREVMDGLPRWIPQHDAQTNSAGEFRFAELPAGEYKLLSRERADDDPVAGPPGRMFGYPPVFYPGAADFVSAETIHISAGESVEADLVAARQPYYRVNIPISSSDLSAGVNVTVRSQAGPGYSLGYNSATKRIEGFLPNGNFIVEATSFGPNIASGVVNLKVDGTAAQGPAMTLVPGGSISLDVKEHLTDKTNFSASSSWNDGKRTITLRGPRAYLQAQLESADESEPMRGTSLRPPIAPNDESFVLENVLPGRYWLRLITGRGYIASARIGDLDLLRQPLVVTPGPSAPIEVELRDDSAEIEATVTGIETPTAGAVLGTSGASAWIYCVPLPDSPGHFQEFRVSQDGQLTYAMAPGGYLVLAFASPQHHLPYRDAEAMKAYESKGPSVQLSAGQKLSVQVPLITESDAPEK